jgi:hypothetical protein
MKDKEWTKVGSVGVDAGLMMIGDPSYSIGANPSNDWITDDWDDFCRELFNSQEFAEHQVVNVPFSLGHEGAAVVTSTGFGDGSYDVFVKYSDEGEWGRRVAEAKIVFIEDEEIE